MGGEIGVFPLALADLLRKQAVVSAESTAVEDARRVQSCRTFDRRLSRFACVLADGEMTHRVRLAPTASPRRALARSTRGIRCAQASSRHGRAGHAAMVPCTTGRLQRSLGHSVCRCRRVSAQQHRQDTAPRDRAPMGKPVIPVVRRFRFGKHPVTQHAA